MDNWNIETTRQVVDKFLADGGVAYGFSTMLGHLDHHQGGDFQQDDLLDAHLVGEPSEYDADMMRAITKAKIVQLRHSRTGIAPATFEAVVDAFGNIEDDDTFVMNLTGSYGSGDVVPASWWARALLGYDIEFLPGDVIALINGSFIPSGVTQARLPHWKSVVDEIMQLIEQARQGLEASEVQPSVSLRDLSPMHHLHRQSTRRLEEAVMASISTESGNPLWIDGQPQSNSSFLDFLLTVAVRGYMDALNVISAYARSATWWASQRATEPMEAAYLVQLPKVSKVCYDQIVALSGAPVVAQSESFMIEDIGDTSLQWVWKTDEAIEYLRQQSGLLRRAL